MALLWDALLAILNKPTIFGMLSELAWFTAPLWMAVLVGLVVGWSWKPKWVEGRVGVRGGFDSDLAETQLPCGVMELREGGTEREERRGGGDDDGVCVAEEDLRRLWRLVEESDGGPSWVKMMDRDMPTMSYRAWRRDVKGGPPEYRSRTVFEDVTPEIMRDFFWDDDFRIKSKWDNMLIHHETLEECPITGTMIVQWVRKFPFFCSDREYIIGRRIWKLDGTYYCVTKGVTHSRVPQSNNPRRVDLYHSSWCIRPVESSRGNDKMTACEVLLFHQEDMGIPWEIAKLGIRQGMWGAVKKIEPGLRAYQIARETNHSLPRCAVMAQLNTKVGAEWLQQLEPVDNTLVKEVRRENQLSPSKLLFIVGAIAVACTLDRGLLGKAMIFGVGRRFARPPR